MTEKEAGAPQYHAFLNFSDPGFLQEGEDRPGRQKIPNRGPRDPFGGGGVSGYLP